ncbi:MAG: hypothetical protein QXJ84_05120 [Desulfurococcaceae archaeon]
MPGGEEEEVETEVGRGKEAEEETGEILIDQLRLLLDITKLWHRILHGEASIEDLKSMVTVKPSRKLEEAEGKKTTKRRAKTAKVKEKKARKSRRKVGSK